jgi:hypothetical protein
MSTTQEIALKAYNELLAQDVKAGLEIKWYDDKPEIKVYCAKNLMFVKKALTKAGLHIPELKKAVFSGCTDQYAQGTSKEGIEIMVFAENVFEGCKIVEIETEIEVPEQSIPAQSAHIIPAHKEIVKKKIVKCGVQ